eukprot:1708185-Pyramimonas_sp.AAC.2
MRRRRRRRGRRRRGEPTPPREVVVYRSHPRIPKAVSAPSSGVWNTKPTGDEELDETAAAWEKMKVEIAEAKKLCKSKWYYRAARLRRNTPPNLPHTVEVYAKKHVACLQGALGFLGCRRYCCEKRDTLTPKANGRPGVSGLGFLVERSLVD